jgi:hypothetical protein
MNAESIGRRASGAVEGYSAKPANPRDSANQWSADPIREVGGANIWRDSRHG